MIRNGCGHFDLRLPLTTTPLPLRAYSYIASLASLPFWRALGGPVAPLDEWRFGSWWAVAFPPEQMPKPRSEGSSPQDDGPATDLAAETQETR